MRLNSVQSTFVALELTLTLTARFRIHSPPPPPHTHRFWRFVSQPPVRIMEATDEAEGNSDPVTLETPRFMAVVWGAGGHGDGPTTIVQLDGHGEGVGAM
jgi:hypothetical protein